MTRMRTPSTAILFSASALAAAGLSCARVDVQPIEVKPIHITVDVNVRIDRELDEFFAFEEEMTPPATAPTTAPSNAPQTASK